MKCLFIYQMVALIYGVSLAIIFSEILAKLFHYYHHVDMQNNANRILRRE